MAASNKRRKLSNDNEQSNVEDVEDTKPSTKESNRSLFVRSLPASVTNEKLAEHFSQSYPLKHATIVLDPKTKTSRGFGFVTFTDAEDANAAAAEFNDSLLDGRRIKVEIAEARHREIAENVPGRAQSVNVKGQELRAQRQQQNQENQPPKLIIRNLPWSIKTSEDLTKLFLSFGKVKHAVVPKLPESKHEQAGFGIVILRGKKNAENALKGVNGKVVDGRTLAVDWAVDKDTWAKVRKGELEGTEQDLAEEQPPNIKAGKQGRKEITPEASQEDRSDGDESPSPEKVGLVDEDVGNVLDEELLSEDEGVDIEEAMEDEQEDPEEAEEEATASPASKPKFDTENTTIFIRNLPFTTDDDSLFEHFKLNFGPVRYARVVYDHETERSRGTAFVCFRHETDARDCVKNAPKPAMPSTSSVSQTKDRKRKGEMLKHSILQNEAEDPSGKYTLEGRVLQVTRALNKDEADRRADENTKEREKRANDTRRLYLLSEGTITRGSKLYNTLNKAELDIREASAKQRQKLVKQNPNLGLSLTRLSVRNLPRWIDGKELKQLAREAMVEFAKEVKEGKRQPLSKEEIARGGQAEREAEKKRREQGKGIVKQTKIVYESESTGAKIGEGKGGRSRGYGFIEYHSHRNALMGLRWLNGHTVKGKGGDGQERNKKLIVEFAIENAQVVQRRNDREKRAKERKDDELAGTKRKREETEKATSGTSKKLRKSEKDARSAAEKAQEQEEKNKLAARNRIIAQKRQKRKVRRGKS